MTNDFTEKLIDVTVLRAGGPSDQIVQFLRSFVQIPLIISQARISNFGPIEDIFTCIDLSANIGHHLGPKYSPSDLRSVRRGLIVRIIWMTSSLIALGRQFGLSCKGSRSMRVRVAELLARFRHRRCFIRRFSSRDTVTLPALTRADCYSACNFESQLTQRHFAVKVLLDNADQDGIVSPTALHQRAIALWRSRDEDCACLR
jgi:hypothetical protein